MASIISSIRSYSAEQPAAASLAVACVLASLGLLIAQGCDLQSWVTVDVPPQVRQAIGATEGEDVTLHDAQFVWEAWTSTVTRNTEQLRSAIGEAEERYVVLRTISETGIGAASQYVGTLPGGTILLSSLAGIAGLFLKRPGEDARVAAEKMASYNAGLALAKKTP